MMAWPTVRSVPDDISQPEPNIDDTRRQIANIARTIAKYEPLHMFVLDPSEESGLTHDDRRSSFSTAIANFAGCAAVTLHLVSNVESLWARDTGPVFVRQTGGTPIVTDWIDGDEPPSRESKAVALILSFNQWGRKLAPNRDSRLAYTVASSLSYPAYLAPFVSEGGALEVDGDGTLLVTNSSILNPNRNPGVDQATMESYFASMLGIQKTIWLNGVRDGDATDDHINALARFVEPGVVLLNKPFTYGDHRDNRRTSVLQTYRDVKRTLSKAIDAKGRLLQVIEVPEPNLEELEVCKGQTGKFGVSFSYVNFHLANGAVILSAFGDPEADAEAARIVGQAFPDRVVEQVLVNQLALQGGGIHCATQQILA